jgi:hypothetical protein
MTITNDLLTEITRNVAAEQRPDLDVLGILSNGGDERIELLIARVSEGDEPRRFLITLPRTDVSQFETELRTKLNRVARNRG